MRKKKAEPKAQMQGPLWEGENEIVRRRCRIKKKGNPVLPASKTRKRAGNGPKIIGKK